MNFQEAEKAYQDLRAQYSAGKLSSTDFEEQVSKLKLQDAEGKWWQIGVQSGDWYVHDGQKWSKARPALSAEPPISPAAPPEAEGAIEQPSAPALAPAPIPGIGSKEPRASRLTPRFFSSKPVGRGGGLPTPVLIGIVAVVALVGLAALVGGVLFISGQIGGSTTNARTTPTTVAVVAPPTITVPTLAPQPPILSTNTSIPVVPVVVTPTAAITPTAVVTQTAAPKVVATKKPAATPVPPAATPTKPPNVPPGVYVTKLQLDPPSPNFGDQVGFKVTLMNTTGELKIYRWMVKIFQCSQDPCTENDFRKSFGESTSVQSNIVPGTAELVVPRTWSTGMGPCTYVAMPHYFDPVNQQLLPFPQTSGQPLYYVFKMCH